MIIFVINYLATISFLSSKKKMKLIDTDYLILTFTIPAIDSSYLCTYYALSVSQVTKLIQISLQV